MAPINSGSVHHGFDKMGEFEQEKWWLRICVMGLTRFEPEMSYLRTVHTYNL
jgi:hypothetical protein